MWIKIQHCDINRKNPGKLPHNWINLWMDDLIKQSPKFILGRFRCETAGIESKMLCVKENVMTCHYVLHASNNFCRQKSLLSYEIRNEH